VFGTMRYRQKREQLEPLAAEIMAGLSSVRFAFVGSWRRGKSVLWDLDLLIEAPILRHGAWLFSRFPASMGTQRKDPLQVSFVGPEDQDIHVYSSLSEYWGAALLLWTGPRLYTSRLHVRAQRMGMRFSVRGLYDAGGFVGGRTEKQILSILGLPYTPPEERHREAKRKWNPI
jgi:DNA polymerase (family 10)